MKHIPLHDTYRSLRKSLAAMWVVCMTMVLTGCWVHEFPDTPDTATSRPRGMSTLRGCTVCKALVSRWMRPSSNISEAVTRLRAYICISSCKKEAMRLSGHAATSSTVPWAMT